MLICHCNLVSDRQIRRAVREGALTLGAVARKNGAGACCGGCHAAVKAVIDDERSRADAASSLPVLAPSPAGG